MDLLIGNSFADGFGDSPDPHIVHGLEFLQKFLFRQRGKIVGHQAVHMLLQRADRFHQSAFEIIADAHHLSGGFHLGGKGSLGADELVKGQPGNLYHTVVQHGLKAGVGFSRDGVGNLIQGVAQGNLGRHLGDGITGGLAGQRGRTGHTGIYLDDTVFKAVRIQRVLHVAAAGDAQFGDDIQGRSSQHLVFLVSQSLGRSHHDTVSRMHAHRVDIFHVADRNAVSGAIPHYLILDFLPSGDAALHQHLSHTGKPQAVFQDLNQFLLVVGNAAAAAAQSVGGTKYHRITDGVGEGDAVLHGTHHQRRRHRLPDLFHGILKFLTVLRFLDGLGGGSDQTHVVLL